MTRRRVPSWLAGLLLAALVGCFVAAPGYLWWNAGRELERVEADKIAWKSQRASPVPLVPLFADPLLDDAGVHLAAIGPLKYPEGLFKADLGYHPPPFEFPSREKLTAIWDLTRPAIEPLRKALRCSRIRYDFSEFPGGTGNLAQGLILGAELARLEGRDAEALRLLALLEGIARIWQQTDLRYMMDPFEVCAAVEWNAVLDGHALSATDAAELCGLLDRLESSRLNLLDQVRTQCQRRRIDALDYTQPDENGNAPSANLDPGASHLWTRRLLACEALRITDSDLRELTRICGLPTHQRAAAAQAMEDAIPDDRLRIQRYSSHWKLAVEPVEFDTDALLRMYQQMSRIATALAWYEAEQGRKPAALQDLVPRYLPVLAACAASGRAIRYENGALVSPSWEKDKDVVWPVRRR